MKEKKTLILLIMIAIVGIVGLTIAYFTNTTSIDNLFSTKDYGTTVTEVFESPDNWLPGTTTNKTIEVTNSGSVDEAVRISYTEKWKSKKGNTLSGLIDSNGNLTDEEENSEHAAIINFSDNGDFTYSNGYYYYNYKLAPNEKTSTLIDSVTFNSKVKNDSNCTTVENNGVKTITCNSTQDGYDGATYTLTFTIETVQYDKYMNAWNTDVAILDEQALFCDAFEVGEVVEYNNADYYVLKDSSTSDDYVTLLKKDPLTASEVNQYSTDYLSQDGEYPYYTSDTCNENIQTGCSTNYDTSDVKKIVDGWSSSFSNDLVSVDGYKTRLVNYDDLFNSLHYKADITPSSSNYYATNDTPEWSYINNIRYWSIIDLEDSNAQVFNVGGNLISENTYNKSHIRPVINLKKSAIEDACYVNKSNEYFTCELGEKVIFDNQEYNVLEDSNETNKYVTLLKSTPLTAEEINTYSTDYVSQHGEYPFCLNDDECEYKYGDIWDYKSSIIKRLINDWASQYKNDLFDSDKVDLIDREKMWDYGYIVNNSTENTPSWIYSAYYSYWAITIKKTNWLNGIYGISNKITNEQIDSKLYVRPVINLKKSAIESGCGKNNINNLYDYNIGETVTYKNTNYCVINNSSINSDYVTLLKQEPLTYDELVTYNSGYEIGRDSVDNNVGIMNYYKSSTCYYNNENTAGCNNYYDNSYIKNVINNWSNQFNSDLKEVNGYKVRLISNNELNNMGHVYTGDTSDSYVNKSSYECLYIDSDYWTKSSSIDLTYTTDVVSKTDDKNGPHYVYNKYAVRPVINLKKCAIDGTC